MTVLIADGFDFYNSNVDAAYAGSPWVQATSIVNFYTGASRTPYNAGQSALTGSASSLNSITFSNEPTLYLSFNYYNEGNFTGTNSDGMFIEFLETTGIQVTLQWGQDGNFYVRAGGKTGTIIGGPWAHGMAPFSWCHWQAKVVINNTTGSVELRKNNNSVDDLNLTGLNTRNGTSNNYANNIIILSGNNTAFIDDVLVNNASGSTPNTWPTQLRAIQLMPTADTAQKDFTPLSGTTHFNQVNELKMDSDTSYNYASVAGNTDLYTCASLPYTPSSIPFIVVRQSFKKSDTGARSGTTHILSGATAVDGATVLLATTYQWQNTYYAADPATSAAWTAAGVNALQVGPKVVA